MTPSTDQAYQLLHDGALALANVSLNGVCVDVPYCENAIKWAERRIEKLEAEFFGLDDAIVWRDVFGAEMNTQSGQQLATVLFKHCGYEPIKVTATGQASTDSETLESLGSPMVDNLLEQRGLKKTAQTFLKNLIRESVDGVMHPFFNLEYVVSFRSASQGPNFQNLPKRNPLQASLVRQAIRPSDGNLLLEADFKAAEVGTAACYHQDPTMIQYLEEGYDYHMEMASECYDIHAEDVTKKIRYDGKNAFVFPEFYGSNYAAVAPEMWKRSRDSIFEDGDCLHDHLLQTFTNYKGFEAHIQKVEHSFWQERFGVYSKWKLDHYNEYKKKGWFRSLTGFEYSGVMSKMEVINYPIQGSAFHCLLWVLIQLDKWLMEKGMASCIIGQIHDSILMDVDPEEKDEILSHLHHLVSVALPARWGWICVPIEIEVEISEVDGDWANMTEIEL